MPSAGSGRSWAVTAPGLAGAAPWGSGAGPWARTGGSRRRPCGGIVWSLGSPAGTITTAEYIALTAELSQYRRTSSTFHDPGLAARWLSDARRTLSWLQGRRLVNLRAGTVRDSLAQRRCH